MKRIAQTVVSVLLFINLVGCGTQPATDSADTAENSVSSIQDIQGFWYDDDSYMVMGFKGNEYIIYGFGTQISITGTFEVDAQAIILHSDEYSDKIFKSARIEDDILSFKTEDGSVVQWESITEAEVERMLLEDAQ